MRKRRVVGRNCENQKPRANKLTNKDKTKQQQQQNKNKQKKKRKEREKRERMKYSVDKHENTTRTINSFFKYYICPLHY